MNTLQPGTTISNGARIYFDFNAPIFTNFVYNTVVTPTGIVENPAAWQVNLFPNPAKDNTTVAFNSAVAGTLTAEVYNVLGVMVNQEAWRLQPGFNSFDMKIGDLAQGVYFVRFSNNGETTVSRLTKN